MNNKTIILAAMLFKTKKSSYIKINYKLNSKD